ncbi:hypothetical protein [Ekhidna sp. To15]|uniref:hypothetical protein n=1 Tax=Ekhidna sp. To15 TaxID=3395267 RepID=UPI003F51F986
MDIKDLIITPIYFIAIILIAYLLSRFFVEKSEKKIFLLALSSRMIGAIALGVVYQFYYSSGDTFTYWQHGSYWIWKAFHDNPLDGLRLIFGDISSQDLYQYVSNIWVSRSDSGMFVVRVAGFFDLLTGHTYSATALFFGLIGFSGSWSLYTVLKKRYPNSVFYLRLFLLFLPSVIIWGSGIMKDTLAFAATCWCISLFLKLISGRQNRLFNLILIILCTLVINEVKPYILLSLIPSFFVWIYFRWILPIKNLVLKLLIAPIILICVLAPAYFLSNQVGNYNSRYQLDSLAERARITANDIRYWTGKDAGSGYTIGEHDGTWVGLLRMAPQGVIVSVFRPFIWEVNNPLMLLSAFECLLITYFFISAKYRRNLRNLTKDPFLVFAVTFVLVFAFAVGVSTFNFGTLVRYRIPMYPMLGAIIGFLKSKP